MSAFRPNRSDVTLSGLTVSGNEGPSVARASQRWAMAMESRWDSRAGASRKQRGAVRLTLSDQIKANAETLRVDATLGTPAEVAEGSRAERDRLPKGARRVRAAARIGAVSGDRAGAEVGGAINRGGRRTGESLPASWFMVGLPKSAKPPFARSWRFAGFWSSRHIPSRRQGCQRSQGAPIRRRFAMPGLADIRPNRARLRFASARQAKMNESSHVLPPHRGGLQRRRCAWPQTLGTPGPCPHRPARRAETALPLWRRLILHPS